MQKQRMHDYYLLTEVVHALVGPLRHLQKERQQYSTYTNILLITIQTFTKIMFTHTYMIYNMHWAFLITNSTMYHRKLNKQCMHKIF